MSRRIFDRDTDDAGQFDLLDHEHPHDDVVAGEYVEVRPQRGGGLRKVLLVFLAGLVLLVVAAGVGAWWLTRQIDPPGEPGAEVALSIPDGSSTATIAGLLEEEGVISNATLFRYYVRFRSAGPFQAGSFTFQENSAMGDVVAVLDAGPQAPSFISVTVPEGLTLAQTNESLAEAVPRFSADRLAEVTASGSIRSRYQPPDSTSLEGLLYPETYRVEEDEDEAALLTRMVGQLDAVAAGLGYDGAEEAVALTPYELIIVASLIEEEARLPEEQAQISRVIHNRLAQGMPLGIDATSLYEAEAGDRELTQSDLESDSPYNTRRRPGLPPTPIASPGRGALEAALRPAEGDALYYVLADEQGRHFFTADYEEFLRAKEEAEEKGLL